MRRILIILLILLLGTQLGAQNTQRDTSFNAKQLIAPSVLIGSGTLIHCFGHDSIDQWAKTQILSLRGNYMQVDDYLQWAPMIMDFGMAFIGIPSEKGAVDRTIELALATISMAAITRAGKALISSQRPNGGDFKSFPSGHSAKVFMAAELVRMEYGPWWGAGAYAIAGGVGVLRMYNNRHWFSDVLAGAGVGILSAHIGEWLLEPTKRLFKIPDSSWGNGRKSFEPSLSFAPSLDPISGTLCPGIALSW